MPIKLQLKQLEKYQKMKNWDETDTAKQMGISYSQLWRVKTGECNVGEEFIAGALRAFPELEFSDLFIVVNEPSEANTG